ncbi:MAG: T9SS type A sorting domain-containing protein [Bacteroidota bacterium]
MKNIIITLSIICISVSSTVAQRSLLVLNRLDHNVIAYPLEEERKTIEVVIGKDESEFIFRAYDLIVDESSEKFLWIEGKDRSIKRGNFNNNNKESLIQVETAIPIDIDYDYANKLYYWLDGLGSKIYFNKKNGNNLELLPLDNLNQASSLAIDPVENKIYWTELSSTWIYSTNLEKLTEVDSFNTPDDGYPIRLEIDHKKREIYWSNDVGAYIFKSDLDGKNQKELYRGTKEESPYCLLLDTETEKLYWTDYFMGTVNSMNLDGSNPQQLIAGLREPLGLAIVNKLKAFTTIPLEDKPIKNNIQSLLIYPNPASNKVNIWINNPDQKEIKLIVMNALGEVVFTANASDQTTILNMNEHPAGQYLCKAYVGTDFFQQSFVLVK